MVSLLAILKQQTSLEYNLSLPLITLYIYWTVISWLWGLLVLLDSCVQWWFIFSDLLAYFSFQGVLLFHFNK